MDAIPSGATTVDPRPELVVVAEEPAAGEGHMSEARECEVCVDDQAVGNVREENMSEGALLANNDSPIARIPKCGCSLTTTLMLRNYK